MMLLLKEVWLFSELDFGCQIVFYGDVEKTVRYSIMVEECGFDTVTLPDHLFHPVSTEEIFTEPPWEAFTVFGAIASKTEKVDLMPAVADTVRRHPALLAHTIATLDQMTDGRTMLGIGAGEAFNITPVKDFKWDKPYTIFREYLKVVKDLWTSEEEDRVNFEGWYFHLEDAYLGFKPHQKPYPPIYIGGWGEKMRTFIGEKADGWIPWVHTPKQYEQDLKTIIESARDAGRDPKEIDRVVMLPSVVLSDHEKAQQIAKPRSKTMFALRSSLLKKSGYPELAEEIDDGWKLSYQENKNREIRNISKKIPDEAVSEIMLAGDPSSVREQIDRFVEAGVSRLIIVPVGRYEETLKKYKNEIIPYYKN